MINSRPNIIQNQRGTLLASLLIIMAVLTVISFSLFEFTTSQYARTTRDTFAANAVLVAEAGVEQSLFNLNQDATFAGYGTDQVFFNDATQGKGVFKTTITSSGAGNAKVILATGNVYRYNASASAKPVSTRKIKVTVVGTGSSGYSVHTGPGGLILGGSAGITNSEVYVNGGITMTGSARIGTASQPLNVKVANQRCPTTVTPGPTYPQVCSTGQPISLEYSTFIYGSVCATGQTSTGPNPTKNIQPGNSGSGLMAGCVAPPVAPPVYDRTAQLSRVATTAAGNNNTYVCNNWPFDRTWPANLKLTGNVSIASSCNLTIKGDTYITGNFDLSGAATVRVDNSVGTTRPVVMVDGKITVNGSAQIIANNQGTGIHFVSMKSSAACNPNCASLFGNDLKNSQSVETVSVGGAVNMPGMIFQSQWGKLTIAGSGSIGSAVGQTIDMSGAGTIIFGTALSSGSRTWGVTSYQQVF